MVVDWQHAPKSDQETANELLNYLAASVMDYDYLVRVVAAAIAAEREACAQIAVGATEAAEIATLIRARSKPQRTDTHPSG